MYSCYNCKSLFQNKQLICSTCNAILDCGPMDYFELLDINKNFEISNQELEEKYFNILQIIHPDRYLDKNSKEYQLSLHLVSKLNDAYNSLKSLRSRSEYLLKLQNIFVNSDNDNVKIYHQNLIEIYLIREQIENTNNLSELDEIENNCKIMIQNIHINLNDNFHNLNYNLAAQNTIKLRYLEKIIEEISLKKQII